MIASADFRYSPLGESLAMPAVVREPRAGDDDDDELFLLGEASRNWPHASTPPNPG